MDDAEPSLFHLFRKFFPSLISFLELDTKRYCDEYSFFETFFSNFSISGKDRSFGVCRSDWDFICLLIRYTPPKDSFERVPYKAALKIIIAKTQEMSSTLQYGGPMVEIIHDLKRHAMQIIQSRIGESHSYQRHPRIPEDVSNKEALDLWFEIVENLNRCLINMYHQHVFREENALRYSPYKFKFSKCKYKFYKSSSSIPFRKMVFYFLIVVGSTLAFLFLAKIVENYYSPPPNKLSNYLNEYHRIISENYQEPFKKIFENDYYLLVNKGYQKVLELFLKIFEYDYYDIVNECYQNLYNYLWYGSILVIVCYLFSIFKR